MQGNWLATSGIRSRGVGIDVIFDSVSAAFGTQRVANFRHYIAHERSLILAHPAQDTRSFGQSCLAGKHVGGGT